MRKKEIHKKVSTRYMIWASGLFLAALLFIIFLIYSINYRHESIAGMAAEAPELGATTLENENSLYDLQLFKEGFPHGLVFRGNLENFFYYVGVSPDPYYKNLRSILGNLQDKHFNETVYNYWAANFNNYSMLDGIEGEANRATIDHLKYFPLIDYYNTYKHRNPGKIVIAHINGDERDPRYNSSKFFAGHWLYKPGSNITQDLALASPGDESWVYVKNPKSFRNVTCGNTGCRATEMVICSLDNGAINWSYCEQVQFIANDTANKRIKVRRGYLASDLGLPPKSFRANESYMASHVGDVWSGNLLWYYNFATTCPRDESGKTASDIFSDEIAGWFSKEGIMENFDGIEFDLGYFRLFNDADVADVNGDGIADRGFIGDVNVYGLGVYDFYRELREKIGRDKLIFADGGWTWTTQRSPFVLNGVENEMWPPTCNIASWSSGVNNLLFWNTMLVKPSMNLVIYCFSGYPSQNYAVDYEVRRRTHLVVGTATITDSAIEDLAPIDILVKNGKANWLGFPVGDVKRQGMMSPDLLDGAGVRMDQEFIHNWSSAQADVYPLGQGAGMEIRPRGANIIHTSFNEYANFIVDSTSLYVPGTDLLVFYNVSAEPGFGMPESLPRKIILSAKKGAATLGSATTFANNKTFLASAYFQNVGPGYVNLSIQIEENSSVYISGFTAHSAVDALAREYENGAVLVNPSSSSYTFDLCQIFPNSCLEFNETIVTVNGIDAAFIEKTFINSDKLNSAGYDVVAGADNVMISKNSKPVVEFRHDLTTGPVDLESTSITNQDSSSTFGFIEIKSIDLPAGEKKTAYVDIIGDTGRICIKDNESASIGDMSNYCDDTGEILITCPGSSQDYNCTIENSRYKIEGLSHSVVKEVSESPAPTTTLSGNSAGYGNNVPGGRGTTITATTRITTTTIIPETTTTTRTTTIRTTSTTVPASTTSTTIEQITPTTKEAIIEMPYSGDEGSSQMPLYLAIAMSSIVLIISIGFAYHIYSAHGKKKEQINVQRPMTLIERLEKEGRDLNNEICNSLKVSPAYAQRVIDLNKWIIMQLNMGRSENEIREYLLKYGWNKKVLDLIFIH